MLLITFFENQGYTAMQVSQKVSADAELTNLAGENWKNSSTMSIIRTFAISNIGVLGEKPDAK